MKSQVQLAEVAPIVQRQDTLFEESEAVRSQKKKPFPRFNWLNGYLSLVLPLVSHLMWPLIWYFLAEVLGQNILTAAGKPLGYLRVSPLQLRTDRDTNIHIYWTRIRYSIDCKHYPSYEFKWKYKTGRTQNVVSSELWLKTKNNFLSNDNKYRNLPVSQDSQ